MKIYTSEEITNQLTSLPGWAFRENAIEKNFQFVSFIEAFAFMTKVAFWSEKMNHHPGQRNKDHRQIQNLPVSKQY